MNQNSFDKRSNKPSLRIKGLKSKHLCAESIEIQSDRVAICLTIIVVAYLTTSYFVPVQSLFKNGLAIPTIERTPQE